MNLANKITISRILMIPVFVIILTFFHGWAADFLATLIFAVASITDAVDGHIARSRKLVTSFGKFADPLADKLLVTAALVMLVQMGRVQAWVVIVILAREFIITGLRTMAANRGVVIAASSLGKIKTVTQITAIILLLIYTLPILPSFVFWVAGQIMIYVAMFFTLYSGWDYLYSCRKFLLDDGI